MGHRLSQADRREFIGEMNIFTLINLVLSKLVQSSQSYVVRDNEAFFPRCSLFSSFFPFKPPPKTLPLQAAQKLQLFQTHVYNLSSIGVDNTHT